MNPFHIVRNAATPSGSWLLVMLAVCVSGWPADAAGRDPIAADLLIVGGTEGGCAAAVQAARMGVESIVLVNDISWLGGQFSAEGLGAIDENRGPQGYDQTVPFPRAGLFKEVADAIEARNLEKYGRARPGNTRVITTCRPADAEAVFRRLLKPYIDNGQVRLIPDYYPVEATVQNDRLSAVRFQSTVAGREELTVAAQLTIDASDWGDVIKAAGAEHEFGPDLKSKYGEPLAPTSRDEYPLTDMNPITYCMILEETGGEVPIGRPARYDRRNYDGHAYPQDPLWLYASRRLIDHYGYPEIDHPDVLLLCFPAFDYPLDVLPAAVAAALEADEPGASRKNIVQMTRRQRQIVFDDDKLYSLGFLHYLQTVVHEKMADRTHSFRRFRLSDEFGTPDRLPPKPYVRESLRLQAMYVMRQQDVTGYGERAVNYASVMYHDGVACWQFEYDFHPTGRKFLDAAAGAAGPWQNYFRPGRTWGPPYSGKSVFPLRSLVPRRVDGLLGAQKNLGYSSIVSSAVRLHDQSMAVGQAAGAVAAVAIREQIEPRAIPFERAHLASVWNGLCARRDGGLPAMLWPFADLAPDHAAFEAANLLAIRGGLPLSGTDVTFRPDQPADPGWCEEVVRRSLTSKQYDQPPPPPADAPTRGEFARRWWQTIKDLPERNWPRLREGDADDDGLPDEDDPLPFHPEPGSWPAWHLPADEDGNPPAADDVPGSRTFNFTGQGSEPLEGFVNDTGAPFDAARGHGWSRDLRANERRRRQLDGDWRDTFLFTRSHDVWECIVRNGRYRVTVCLGDSGHDQRGQNATVEDQAVFRTRDTLAGQFAEASVVVDVTDGRLTVEIGLPGSTTNTCLNWLRIAPAASN